MNGDERIRLFLALRLPGDALDAIEVWQGGLADARAGGRLVERRNLHVTLAFLGSRPRDELGAICAELRAAAVAVPGAIVLEPERYRETRSVGMLVLRDLGGRAGGLACDLHARLAELGMYRSEGREWLPHLTVVRFRSRPHLRPGLPNVRSIVPSDAAAYLSRLSPSGAEYEVLETVSLGG